MSESPVELARVRDDSCCRVEDTLQLVGRLHRSAFVGGLLRLHEADAAAVDWLTTYGS